MDQHVLAKSSKQDQKLCILENISIFKQFRHIYIQFFILILILNSVILKEKYI